jgi:dihydroorotate dehydrogenase
MNPEQTQKQVLLITALISGVGGIVSAIGGIVGNFTDLFGKIDALNKLPSWSFWAASFILFVLGLWLLIKWRTRYSRLLKPDALRLDRDNSEHLVGRTQDIDNLLQQCVLKQVVFLEGESGSGKSALVRSGLLPRLKSEKSILPLVLPDLWVDHWEQGPTQALRIAMMNSGAFSTQSITEPGEQANPSPPATPPLSTLADIEDRLTKLNGVDARTALIIFDQFDDYQARNRDRFLPNKTWLSPEKLREENPFWEMVARLLKQQKVRALFVTRNDTAAGLNSVQFLGAVEALRLDRVESPYISELLARLTEGKPDAPIVADPDAGWNKLRERIVRDISQQDVVLPQQLKIMLGGIQSLKQLNIAQYERAGGASGIEALYVEQQITGTSRKVGLEAAQVRAILVTFIDPSNPTKTRSCTELDLASVNKGRRSVSNDKLAVTLKELERGEMLRSASDPESGLVAYRLDHDYLTRGVLAAERRANRWQYVLADGAKGFENAGSLSTRWKALLPIVIQLQLAWQRIRGRFRYGTQRSYALASLLRLVPFAVVFLVLSVGGWQFSRWREDQVASEMARNIWLKFDFRKGVSERELEGAWALAATKNIYVRTDFVRDALITKEYAERLIIRPDLVVQSLVGINPDVRAQMIEALGEQLRNDAYDTKAIAAVAIAARLNAVDRLRYAPILDAIKLTKDPNALNSLSLALVTVGKRLKAEEAYTLANLVMEAISGTKISDQIGALAPVLVSLAPRLREEDAYAVARQILDAKKANRQPGELSAVFTALASHLKSDDAKTIGSAIMEAMKETKSFDPERTLAKWLANVAPRLKSQDAMALDRQIFEMSKDSAASYRWALAPAFIATTRQLSVADAEILLKMITESIRGKIDPRLRRALGLVFTATISRLKPDDARTYAYQILEQIKKSKNTEERAAWASAFAGAAAYLKTEEVTATSKLLVDILNNRQGLSGDVLENFFLSRRRLQGIGDDALKDAIIGRYLLVDDAPNDNAAIAALLKSEDALVLGRRIIDQIVSSGFSGRYISALSESESTDPRLATLVALAPKLTPEGSYELASKIVQNLPKPSPPKARSLLIVKAFTEIVRNLRQGDAFSLARSLVDDIKDTKNISQVQALGIIVARLSSSDVSTIAELIAETAKNAKTGRQLVALGPVLIAIAPQLKDNDIQTFLDLLVEEIAQSVDDDLTEATNVVGALITREPWPERLNRITALLKYPTVYGGAASHGYGYPIFGRYLGRRGLAETPIRC